MLQYCKQKFAEYDTSTVKPDVSPYNQPITYTINNEVVEVPLDVQKQALQQYLEEKQKEQNKLNRPSKSTVLKWIIGVVILLMIYLFIKSRF